MKEIYVSDLQPNQIITSTFLVQAKDVRFKKTGEGYLSLSLSDKTGEVEAKIWENVEEFTPLFERDDFIKVKGAVQVFRKKPQLTVHKLRRLEETEVDLGDFFPRSARDPEEMWQELEAVAAAIQNPHLGALLSKIIGDPEIATRLRQAPAAKTLHHAYIGGLLEHILSLCRLAKLVLQNYPGLDEDLVIAGVLLHDLGKIYELSYARSFGYTSDTAAAPHLRELFDGIELLIHEANFSAVLDPDVDYGFFGHGTARDAGQLATRSNCRRLALVHLAARYAEHLDVLRAEAAEEFDGEIIIPQDGDTLTI